MFTLANIIDLDLFIEPVQFRLESKEQVDVPSPSRYVQFHQSRGWIFVCSSEVYSLNLGKRRTGHKSWSWGRRDRNKKYMVSSFNPNDPDRYDFGPVQKFWTGNKEKLPNLYKLARKVLSTPASSVYSERLFSEYGTIYEDKRSRLLPRRSQRMLFLHHNYKCLATTRAQIAVAKKFPGAVQPPSSATASSKKWNNEINRHNITLTYILVSITINQDKIYRNQIIIL